MKTWLLALALLGSRGSDEDMLTLKMTEGLAWKFSRASRQETKGKVTRDVHSFETPKPVEGARLHFVVSTDWHPDEASAKAAFDALLAGADHNTGLSYAWDWVGLSGTRVVHVAAPCLFSKKNAGILFENAKKMTEPTDSFECVCGGGCGR